MYHFSPPGKTPWLYLGGVVWSHSGQSGAHIIGHKSKKGKLARSLFVRPQEAPLLHRLLPLHLSDTDGSHAITLVPSSGRGNMHTG